MKKLFLLLLIATTTSLAAQNVEPLWQGKGRIAISSDGNEHDDDDWSATPFSLAMLSAAGLQDDLVLYTYSDHIWGSNKTYPFKSGLSAYDQMNESALVGGAMFGFDKTKFICAVDDPEVAYEAMKREINRSTKRNPLIIVGAGPMQVIGEALNRAEPKALKYVTLLSHSDWNNVHADEPHSQFKGTHRYQEWDQHEGWTWSEMKEKFESQGVNFVSIKDQNGPGDHKGLYCKMHYFDWMLDSPARGNDYYKAGSWVWLYSRLGVCIKGKSKDCFDISDAGMIIYLLTGKQEPKVESIKMILENPANPAKW